MNGSPNDEALDATSGGNSNDEIRNQNETLDATSGGNSNDEIRNPNQIPMTECPMTEWGTLVV